MLKTKEIKHNELSNVLGLLYEAALKLKNKGLEQWSIWLNPSDENIKWIEDGINNGEFFWVYNENNEEIGLYRLSYSDILYWGERNDHAAYIHSLIVKQSYSGNNYGKRILEEVEKKLRNEGLDYFRLDCNAANSWICNYYESMGFELVEKKQMPHGVNNLYQKKLN